MHTCDDHSHSHLSRSQIYDLDKHRSIEWLAIRYKRDDVLILTDAPDPLMTWIGGIARISRVFERRGLSSTAGEFLAGAVRKRESWALAMLAQVHMRREGNSATRVIQSLDARDGSPCHPAANACDGDRDLPECRTSNRLPKII